MRVGRDGERLDEAEEHWEARALVLCFGFEQSKACAGCGGPWAVILSWWVVFVVKMGYPILLVPDTLDGSTRLCMSSGSLFQFV
jgi:hypothetical protein